MLHARRPVHRQPTFPSCPRSRSVRSRVAKTKPAVPQRTSGVPAGPSALAPCPEGWGGDRGGCERENSLRAGSPTSHCEASTPNNASNFGEGWAYSDAAGRLHSVRRRDCERCRLKNRPKGKLLAGHLAPGRGAERSYC